MGRKHSHDLSTLWMGTSVASRGKGVETSDQKAGLRREPICISKKDIPRYLVAPAFRKISMGTCAAVHWFPITSLSMCETAGEKLGLSMSYPVVVYTSNHTNRPEGCYLFRNVKE